jgi:CRISPR-associated exonuclease Cas4
MTLGAQDRLISASEVERWCYCPMSWKLERGGSQEDETKLMEGERKHTKLGKEAKGVINAQTKAKEDTTITWTFLAFSMVLLIMGISLIVVTQVGSLDVNVWRVGVVILSILLIGFSIAYYFKFQGKGDSPAKSTFRSFAKGLDKKDLKRYNAPLLFYIYGIILMVNGVVLLRPFGIDDELVRTLLAVSLIVMYLFLLVSVTLYFRANRSDLRSGELKLGAPLVIMLLISLAVLFIFISDHIDMGRNLGWIFLILSLLWFIGAIGYDLYQGVRTGGKKVGLNDKQDLPIVATALLASVFTASTFLAIEDNLHYYYNTSVVIAGAWLVGAVFFFWRGAFQQRIAEKGIEDLSLPNGSEMISADDIEDRKGTKPLTSKKHFLIGAPDMVIEENGYKIPVEIKTGRVPLKPYFSHIMQLSAYMVLMDVNYKQDTPFGYVEYAPSDTHRKRFKVDWDIMTKALVLSKVSEIREAERIGVAHRNHQREGKCRNCSRRQGCSEKLV